MLRSWSFFWFQLEVAGYYYLFLPASITGAASIHPTSQKNQCQMHLLVLQVENEWGWKNGLKQSAGVLAMLIDGFCLFCKDCCVKAKFIAELAHMLSSSRYIFILLAFDINLFNQHLKCQVFFIFLSQRTYKFRKEKGNSGHVCRYIVVLLPYFMHI